jgi:hypothetical protein
MQVHHLISLGGWNDVIFIYLSLTHGWSTGASGQQYYMRGYSPSQFAPGRYELSNLTAEAADGRLKGAFTLDNIALSGGGIPIIYAVRTDMVVMGSPQLTCLTPSVWRPLSRIGFYSLPRPPHPTTTWDMFPASALSAGTHIHAAS